MREKQKTNGMIRLVWSLLIGLGMAMVLLWSVVPRPSVEAQEFNSAPVIERAEDVTTVLQPIADAPLGTEAAPPEGPAKMGGAPLLASLGDGFGARSQPLAPLAPPMPGDADLEICMNSDRVWGLVGAGETVTVSVNGAQMGAAQANHIGFFWTTLYDPDGNRPGLDEGDVVGIYHDGVQAANVTLRAITGQVDVVSDVISGTIGGTGFPISVTVYRPSSGWSEPSMMPYSLTVSTDGSGAFQADFTDIWNLSADEPSEIAYVQGGVEVHRHVYATRIVAMPFPFNSVGSWTTPGLVVTATVYSDATTIREQVTSTANASGRYDINVTMQTSDTVVVELADGMVMSRTVDTLSMNVDPANDRITGLARPGATVRGYVDNLTPLGWGFVQTNTTGGAGGVYTIEFGGSADIVPGRWSGIHVADEEGDDLAMWGPSPSVEVNQTYNEVSGYGAVPFGLGDGWPVTLTLYSAVSDTTFVYSKGMESWFGQYNFDQDDGLPDIAPGDVVTVESQGFAWQGVVQVMTMTVQADLANDRFIGAVVSPTGRVQLDGYYDFSQLYPVGGQFDMLVTATSPFTGAPPGFDVDNYLFYGAAHRTANDYVERIDRVTDGFGMWLPGNGMWAMLPPVGTPYTFTLYNNSGGFKAQLTGTSPQPIGGTGWRDFWSTGEQMQAGDRLQVQSAAGFSQTIIIPDIVISPDIDHDLVTGDAPANTLLHVKVGGQDEGFVPTDSSGHYAFKVDQLQSLSGDGQLEWGEEVAIAYTGPKRTLVFNAFNWPQIRAHYDMEGRNDVWGENAPAGATVIVTVSHPISGVIATGSAIVGTCDRCGPNQYSVGFPDGTVVAGHTVTVNFGSGYVDSVVVLPVTAEANPDTDVVTITTTPGYAVGFNAGGPNGWWEWWWNHDSVEVGPSGVVTFDVSAEYDIVPGTEFNVHIEQVHGHQTHYSFWLPTPELSVDKWNVPGHARPDGVVVYGIEYWNNGDGVAEDTLIVDTLPPNTSWAGDTSGIVPTIGAGGVITWNLGDVAPGDGGGFVVTLDVFGLSNGDTIGQNCVVITTTTPGDYDPGNNGPRCADTVNVQTDEVEVEVDKWPNPGGPAPGQEFEYTVRPCNNRGAAAGPLWLTDTLPLSTTLVGWDSENGDTTYWTEVVTTGGRLVLYAPGFPGDECEDLHLRLLLDPGVPISTTLQNTIVITTAGDVDTDNNGPHVNTDAHVSGPRYDMVLEKSTHRSVPVPGGWVNYFFWYQNRGNMPTHIWITDTVPTDLSYDYANWGGNQPQENDPFPDPTIIGDKLIWDLGVMPVGGAAWFHVQMNISDTLDPGDTFTNCATIGITATEDAPWDNTSCYPITINDHGPNLYVAKESEYNPGNDMINYQIRFGNLGDQTVYNVSITDTLSLSTTHEWHNVNWGGSQYTDTAYASGLAVVFGRIEPGQNGEIQLGARVGDPNARFRWYVNTVEIDTPPDDANPADNFDSDTAFSGGEVESVDLDVYGNNLWGCAYSPPVTITTIYTERVLGWECWDEWFEDPFEPGDVVTVAAGEGILPVVIQIPDPFTAYASSITDTVWGQIDALDHELINVDLDDGPNRDVQTDGSGNYSATFANIPRGGHGWVNYETEIAYAEIDFHGCFQAPDLIMTVDYRDDWVNGNYEPGHTVWITDTESDGLTVKATAVLSTGLIPWWGGRSGFETQGDDWSPSQPDIQPGDWVYGLVNSESYTAAVRVGAINGEVNVDKDTVSGTIDAPWLAPDLITVNCEIHEENGQSIQVNNVDPDGGSFFCDFDGLYDIEPGHNVAVNYAEPDGDRVQTHPANPTPYLRINKWAEGNPGEGGNLAFHVQYQNQGGDDAEDVVITDTLQGMTYITDTSGLSHTGSGIPSDPVVWQLGTVGPQENWIEFIVFVEVTEVAGNRITNTVQIATSDPYDQGDPGEKESWWWADVQDNGTQLWVNKDAWTYDPVPDSEFVYTVDPCNGGQDNTNSAWTTVTDTLPFSTTLVSWWADDPGWSPVMEQDHLLVVQRPTVDAHHCARIYLRVYLTNTVSSGDELCNQAEIFADNDTGDLGDNQQTWCHNVGEPHTNLGVDKWWAGGQLVPGGEMRYHGQYYNDGNLSVDDVLITETLPANTSLVEWRHYDSNWNEIGLVSPTFVPPNQYVWDVGTVENGERGHYQILLQIASNADPGTVLTNTIEISPKPDEDSADDNVDTEVEIVYDHGPNLRIRKEGGWDDWGENTRRASYNLTVENIGDATVMPVVITDTYDSKMYLDGGVGSNYWRWWEWRDNPAYRFFTVTLEVLYPGERMDVNFGTITDTEPLPFGLVFTNTAEVILYPSDANPDDNRDEVVLTTGPDLYVEKTLVAGDLLPGELITFNLRFGNDHQGHEWWWNLQGDAWLTDTLPAGFEYITSTQRWCGPEGEWCARPPDLEDGTHLTWHLWPIGAGGWNEIHLTVRITDTATGLDTFTNWVEIASDQPISDTEGMYDNNADSLDIPIALPHFQIGKVYESGRVAGMPVTYTLTVTNVGHAVATGVNVTDTVPAYLSDHSGTAGFSWVGWSLGPIAPDGGTDMAEFSATLPCTTGLSIVNDDYGVRGSDQGVSGPAGAPVSFSVIAPTMSPTFTQSATLIDADTTVTFTDTSTTDGTDIIAWAWDFGDTGVASGEVVSHTYGGTGGYTVTLTITDTCGISESNAVPNAVVIAKTYVFLPLVLRGS